jgi:hypothetical protein
MAVIRPALYRLWFSYIRLSYEVSVYDETKEGKFWDGLS